MHLAADCWVSLPASAETKETAGVIHEAAALVLCTDGRGIETSGLWGSQSSVFSKTRMTRRIRCALLHLPLMHYLAWMYRISLGWFECTLFKGGGSSGRWTAVASIFVRAALPDSCFTAQHSQKILPPALPVKTCLLFLLLFYFLKDPDVYLSSLRSTSSFLPSHPSSHPT